MKPGSLTIRRSLASRNPATEVAGSRAAVYVGADGVGIDLDNSTLTHSSSTLAIKANGVTETQLNTSVAGDGLTGGGGSALAVGAGNGISVAANAVAVAADGTGGANLATVVDVNSNGVAIKIDDSTIKENGSNQLYVAAIDGGTW